MGRWLICVDYLLRSLAQYAKCMTGMDAASTVWTRYDGDANAARESLWRLDGPALIIRSGAHLCGTVPKLGAAWECRDLTCPERD